MTLTADNVPFILVGLPLAAVSLLLLADAGWRWFRNRK